MATASDRCGIHRKKISENDLKKRYWFNFTRDNYIVSLLVILK